MANSKKYKKRKSKPMFKQKRKKGNSVLGIIFMIIILAALVFVGYSVGKPIVEFISGERETSVNSGTSGSSSESEETTENTTTAATSEITEATTEEPEPTVAVGTNICYISYTSGIEDYEGYVYSMVEYAYENGYSGVCVELIAEGGTVTYSSGNTTATESGAVIAGGISSLSDLVSTINSYGMSAYARISTLTDNIASSYDKSLAYMISGTDTRWYDNNTASGGKPWISPFSSSSEEYIGGLVSEISGAGFIGLVAGEIEFPPFRNSDLKYFDSSVTSSSRYETLISFAEVVYNSFGSAKEFYVEVDAEDVISGDCEILNDTDSLCTSTIYVNFNPDNIGTRITRSDGTEVSFEGLNSAYLFRTVFNLVEEALEDKGVTVIPKITGCEITDDLLSAIELMGYDSNVIIEE